MRGAPAIRRRARQGVKQGVTALHINLTHRFREFGLAVCLVLFAGAMIVAAHAEQEPAQQEPAATHLAAARQLVVSSGMSRSFASVVPQIMNRLTTTFTQTRPELAHDLDAVLTDIKPEFDKEADQMIDTAAHIFARLMNEQEIKSVNAFFESEAGKKYVEIQPTFFNDVVNAMQAWQQKLSQEMVARAREEMKKKGHDL
jgi:uncharacterized protein